MADRPPPRRSRGRRRLAALLLVLAATATEAQRLTTVTYGVDDGLPSRSIFELAQDGDGRVWILSRGGLTVYDGRVFRTQTPADGLPADPLRALTSDAAGRMWVASERAGPRIHYRAGDRWRSLPDSGLRETEFGDVRSLAVSGDASAPRVALGSRAAGLLVWNGETWRRLGVAEGLPTEKINRLTALDDGIAVATDAGLCRLAADRVDCRWRRLDPRLAGPIDVTWPDGEALWILGRGWLGRLEDDRLAVLAQGLDTQSYAGLPVGHGGVDRSGGVYFGSAGVLYFRDPLTTEIRTLTQRDGLAGEGVTAILVDREDNVWIGGLRGLTMVDSLRFLSYDQNQGLLEDEVSALAEPFPGRLVLGHNHGFTFLEGSRVTSTLALPPMPGLPENSRRALDLAVDAEGTTWAAMSEKGLVRLTPDGGWTTLDPDGSGVLSVEIDPRGRLWLATREAIYHRDGDRFVRASLTMERHGQVRWLHAAGDVLYAATTRGLRWREDGDEWRAAYGPDLRADNLYAVLATSEGTVWLGSNTGLYRLRGDAFEKVADGALAVDRPIYTIFRGPRGRLWIGTDDGLLVWDGERLRQLSVRHGLAGRELNRGATLIDYRGRIWAGTDRGVSVYRAERDHMPTPPRVELRDVKSGDDHHDPRADFRLGHDHGALAFRLETIAFSREETVLYRFRLEGFDPGWQGPTPLADPVVRYTNLPPGEYRFRIAARWGVARWGEEARSATIIVARPPWREPWVIALTVAAVAGALLLGHGLRTRAIRGRARELESFNRRLQQTLDEKARAEAERERLIAELRAEQEERERLIAELEAKNAELERFTYSVSHDLKSPLVTIKGFLGFLQKDAAAGRIEQMDRDVEMIRGAAEKMGVLLDELLELSRIGRIESSRERVTVDALAREAADLVAMRLAAREVELEIAPDLPVVEVERGRLVEVFQNLIDNAAKFMGDQSAPRIEVDARRDGDRVVCRVSDNGMGIDPQYQEKIFGLFERLHPYVEGTGIGLALVRRIVETHGGRIWVESPGIDRGATFFFTLPATAAEPASAPPAEPRPRAADARRERGADRRVAEEHPPPPPAGRRDSGRGR